MSETTTETPVVTEEAGNENRIGAMHEAFANYIKTTKGIEITAEQVFAVTSTRVAFRKSDSYLVGVKEAKIKEKVDSEASKAAAAAEKAASREKAAAEKAAAKKIADAEKAAAKAKADAEKAAAGDSGEALAAANAATEKKTGKAPKAAQAKTESPF